MLTLLTAFSGTGKSTYARKHANENQVIVSADSIRYMLHGRYVYSEPLESLVHDLKFRAAAAAFEKGLSVIVDETNLKREYRDSWRAFGRDFDEDRKKILGDCK